MEHIYYVGPAIVHNITNGIGGGGPIGSGLKGLASSNDSGIGKLLSVIKQLSILFTIFTFIPVIVLMGLLNVHFPQNTYYFLQLFLNLLFKQSPPFGEDLNWEEVQTLFGLNVLALIPNQRPVRHFARYGISSHFIVNSYQLLLSIAIYLCVAIGINQIHTYLESHRNLGNQQPGLLSGSESAQQRAPLKWMSNAKHAISFLNKFFRKWVITLYETQFLELNLYVWMQLTNPSLHTFFNGLSLIVALVTLLYFLILFLFFFHRLNRTQIKWIRLFLPKYCFSVDNTEVEKLFT